MKGQRDEDKNAPDIGLPRLPCAGGPARSEARAGAKGAHHGVEPRLRKEVKHERDTESRSRSYKLPGDSWLGPAFLAAVSVGLASTARNRLRPYTYSLRKVRNVICPHTLHRLTTYRLILARTPQAQAVAARDRPMLAAFS
jgi:hypothetical protein